MGSLVELSVMPFSFPNKSWPYYPQQARWRKVLINGIGGQPRPTQMEARDLQPSSRKLQTVQKPEWMPWALSENDQGAPLSPSALKSLLVATNSCIREYPAYFTGTLVERTTSHSRMPCILL